MAWTTPYTWTVGEILTAAKMQTYVSDNLAFLKTQTDADMQAVTNKSGGTLAVGDVVIWDTANATAVKVTTTARDGRAAGVVLIGGSDNTTVYLVPYGHLATVNVQGNVNIGQALVTSTTTNRAAAAGGATQFGLIGYATTSYGGGGAGTVTAIICPTFDQYAAQIIVEGAVAVVCTNTDAGASGSLVCGSNTNRVVICLLSAVYNAGVLNFGPPTVGGVAMTAFDSERSGWAAATANERFRAYYYIAPATGTVTVATGPIACSSAADDGGVALFIALSGVVQTSPVRTATYSNPTTSTPSVSCTNAVAGDLVVSGVVHGNTSGVGVGFVTGRGSGQTNQCSGAMTAVAVDVVCELDSEFATSATEQSSWTLDASREVIAFNIPVIPA